MIENESKKLTKELATAICFESYQSFTDNKSMDSFRLEGQLALHPPLKNQSDLIKLQNKTKIENN